MCLCAILEEDTQEIVDDCFVSQDVAPAIIVLQWAVVPKYGQ